FAALRDLAAEVESRPRTTPSSLATAIAGFRQPDGTTCGSCALVVAHLHHSPAYAAAVLGDPDLPARLRLEALAVHTATNGLRLAGETQVPWPKALGTAPWALARHLRLVSGRPGSGYAWVRRRDDFWEHLHAAVTAGHPVPLYVGTRLLPRHVVLVLEVGDDHLLAYQPASGGTVRVTRGEVNRDEARALGWPRVWGGVLPAESAVAAGCAVRRVRTPRGRRALATGFSAARRNRA
ncbi:MAG TPA: hypothetical protein VGE77_14660, partial [Nocardioides sp.]